MARTPKTTTAPAQTEAPTKTPDSRAKALTMGGEKPAAQTLEAPMIEADNTFHTI